MALRHLSAIVCSAVLLTACGAEEPDPTDDPPPTPAEEPAEPDEDGEDDADDADGPAGMVELTIRDVATGLDVPWDVAFLDDRVFVTERDRGRVLEVDGASTDEVRSFEVDATGEAGLLGLTAHPDGNLLYAYYTSPSDNRVVRFSPDDDAEAEIVLDGIPKAAIHDGGRLVFGPDGMLYIGTGDAAEPELAADPGSLAGKILRVSPDGDVPDDNPFDGSPVWSLGHRNVQGLAFDADGRLFATELGPDVDDEVNLIEPGADHGWPEVTGEAGTEGYADPILVRQPPEASWSGATILLDGAIPQWEGDLLVAALRGERLWRIELDGGSVTASEELYTGEFGRLRHVQQAPDGSLWLLTSNRDGRGDPSDRDDRILRLGPG